MSTDELPDCQDVTYGFSERITAMAEERANTACGDNRADKAWRFRAALTDLIHHEAKTAFLAGYLRAVEDFKSNEGIAWAHPKDPQEDY